MEPINNDLGILTRPKNFKHLCLENLRGVKILGYYFKK